MPARSERLKVAQPVAWFDRRTIIGLLWLIGFVVFFSSFDFPNNPPASRRNVWNIVPLQVLDVVWPPTDPQTPPSGWKYLLQRLPALLTALAVMSAALGLGFQVLQRLKLWDELTRLERIYFAGGVGLSLWSLLTLGLGLAGCLHPVAFWLLVGIANGLGLWSWWNREKGTANPTENLSASPLLIGVIAAVCVPMLWAMLLGAMTPQSDFDVLAYHLNGPKEWFQQGRISFLPHNVYTSFPFLTEMLSLSGMVLLNNWHYGALAGQAVLWAFTPLMALGLFCAGRRWFSESAGWLAALVWLTTPWTYRITIIAYAEAGLSFYLLASFLAACRGVTQEVPRRSWFVLTGFLAGSAMACKYPGLTSVILPIGFGLMFVLLRRRIPFRELATLLMCYALGVVIAVGPWLAKNLWETGNPVYPLAYSLFDGKDLDPELNAKWVKGHAARTYSSFSDGFRDFRLRFLDVIANNDWHSPLLYGLAPLSLLWTAKRRAVMGAWLFLGWLFLTWFFLTHHIDRFWVPMIPVAAMLAGGGGATLTGPAGRWLGGAVIAAAVAFNLTVCSLFGGYNARLTELSRAEQIAERAMTPELQWLNQEFAAGRLPADFKLLCIGEAATFHARFPVAYHSVFDRCLLEEWCAAGPGPDFPLKPIEEIRATFRRHGITHVFINWRWILTYREPGNYGFTDFIDPQRLQELQESGVLEGPLRLPEPLGIGPLTEERRNYLRQWAPSLLIQHDRQPAYVSGQIFPVSRK